jgi:hypothetical protein
VYAQTLRRAHTDRLPCPQVDGVGNGLTPKQQHNRRTGAFDAASMLSAKQARQESVGRQCFSIRSHRHSNGVCCACTAHNARCSCMMRHIRGTSAADTPFTTTGLLRVRHAAHMPAWQPLPLLLMPHRQQHAHKQVDLQSSSTATKASCSCSAISLRPLCLSVVVGEHPKSPCMRQGR